MATAAPPARLRASLALAFGAFILIGANDGAGGVLLPTFQSFYQVDKATVALLFLAESAGYLAAALASGPLLERLGRRAFQMAGAAALGGSVLVISGTPPFPLLLAALVLTGLGVGLIDAGLNAYIAGLPGNTAALNTLHACYGVGALLGPLVAGGVLAAGAGWGLVYGLWAGLALVVLGGSAVVFRHAGAPPRATAGGANVLGGALWRPAVWLAAAFLLVYVGAEVSLGSWSYSVLTEERGLAALPAGWVVSGYWLGLTLGRLAIGRLAARLGDRRLIQICLGGVVAGLGLAWLGPGSPAFAMGLWIAGASLGPLYPTTIAFIAGRVPARNVPSAIGFMASMSSIGGALGPWLAGNLAQRFGLGVLLPYVIGLALLMLGVWAALQAGARPEAGLEEARA